MYAQPAKAVNGASGASGRSRADNCAGWHWKMLYPEANPVHLNAAGDVIVARRLFERMINPLAQ
jgi:hypothetical protein